MGRSRRINEAVSHSPEETVDFGEALGKEALPNTVFCLFGDLGAGKTTLIKGIAFGVSGILPECVTSPTFVYLNIYEKENRLTVYHFDLYRISDPKQFSASGFDEFLNAGGISCIEWSERIDPILPPHSILIHLSHQNTGRLIQIYHLEAA